MNTYHFNILIRHAAHNDALEDKLFEAGCGDALIYSTNGAVCLEFDREAENARQAVQSAFTQIQNAGFTDLVLQETGYATLGEIAARAGLSRAALSQYALGKRGNGFPAPMYITGKSALYSWQEAAHWLYRNGKLPKSSVEIASLSF